MTGHQANFTSIIHTEVSPAIDPSNVVLPPGFTVLIIGTSRGTGASIARSYATAGVSTLILVARDASSIEPTAASCRDIQPQLRVLCETCDISSAPSVAALAETVICKTSRLDVIVMNSGYSGTVVVDVTKGEPADAKRAMDVNVLGTYHAAHYLFPLLFASSESAKAFLVVSSTAAWITEGPIGNIGYCVGKLAQLRVVEMVSKQFEGKGLLAVSVHPGAVKREMAMRDAPDEFKKYLTDSVDLCGGFCVWLTAQAEKKLWLTGRFIAATGDADQLVERKEEIVEKDLLKAKMAMQ